METPDVPVGNLIDLDTEPLVMAAECTPSLDADGILSLEVNPPENGEREEEIESDATESADSENDMMSPTRHSWNHSQRSSSESYSSNQSTESAQDEQMAEQKEFIRHYVEKIFTGGEDVDQEEKARFGELCSSENGKGREWFARFVSAQRCNSKCVSEQTFYRLVQSFAVVLFECYQMDDFGPAKNLMTMCFTYYYIGKPHVSPTESREKPVSTGSIDAYFKSANSWLAEKKDNVERLLRTTSVTTENMKGFFGGLESKLKGPLAKKNGQSEDPREKPSNDIPLQCPDDKKGEKMYLYSHLKQQPIWHTLRFWNAAFFDAVHCERRKRSPTTRDKWYHMTQEERDDSLQFNENITFGQLGTFTHNMLAFGLSKKLCSDFLKKQAVIGNLDEGLRCVCPSGSAMTGRGSPQVTCNQCMEKKVSLDQRVCLTCNGTACACGSNDVTEEDYITLTYRCVTCTGDTRPNAAGDRCVLCPPTYSSGCSCPAANQVGGVCVPNAPQSAPTAVTFWESLYLYSSFDVCQSYNNFTACQALTNMVIMNTFSATSKAFDLYGSVSETSFLPALTYSTASQLGSTAPTNLSFLKNAQIQFRLAKYDVRGNFLGWEALKGGTLQMCPNTQSTWDAAFKFGTFYSLTCSLSVSDLFQVVPEPVFYELFLLYTSTSGASMLWPIPVWNANIQGGSDTLGFRALRRFFLIDGISGRQTNLSSQPSFVTVATSLTLSVFLPVSPPSSQPPFQLTVTYQKQNLQASAQVSFAVTYTQSQGTFKRDTDIALGVLGSLAGLIAILETSSWLRRSGQQNIGIMVIIKFLAFSCGSLANTFFFIVYGTSIYWLIAFKGQTTTVTVTLPPSGGQVENDFIIYMSVAFALKTLELLHLLVTQLTANIFLIDWERPKDKTAPNSQGAAGKSNASIWRTVLVANEWNEIQTCRKLSPLFQLFMVLLLLEVVGLKNITAKDLNLDLNPSAGTYQAPWSIILRFGIAASMWLAVGLVQVLFVIFIYERFVEDKIKQFADLCSLSNVSVLVLTHKCYGYYIHGRSVHGQADVSMEMMMDNLRKEEENLCPLRGLEPGSDIQTFEVVLSERVREQYDKIMQPLMEVPRGQKAGNEKNPILQQRIRTYYTVNRFLSSFLDHVYKDLDYVVKNKLFLESVLNLEFQQAIDKSIFYNDDRYHFSRAVFYSNELVLLLFDTLLFCIIDLGTQNFILATILTFVIQMFVKILRSQIGRKNLSAQTLVEESFLI